MTHKTKVIVLAALVVVLAGGAYAYVTRPVAAPSSAIEDYRPEPSDAEEEDHGHADADYVRYKIDASSSLVDFQLDEILRGKPVTVNGETNQVAGEILLDLENPDATHVDEIRINARTLKTDSTQRDGAISRVILKSESAEHEYIVFKPGAFMGLPDQIVPGSAFDFSVTGDLTIAGVTKPATFYGSAAIDEKGNLAGNAGASVNRADFNLTIPNLPFIADVEEVVSLRIRFVAVPQS